MKTRPYIAMNVYWFGMAFLWNGLHPIILPALLLRFVPESLKNTTLGGITFVGLILAMVIQPLAGGLSDRTRSRWGRRRPWIVVGVFLVLLVLVGMALANSLWGLVVAYLCLQVVCNVGQGPAQGLIPDLVPGERLGLASGIKNLFDMGGLVVTSLVAGQLMGGDSPTLAFAVTCGVLGVSALITVVATPEEPALDGSETSAGSRVRELLRVNPRDYPDYAWLLVSRLLILLGIYAVQNFAQYYVRDWLRMENPAEVTGNLLAMIGLALTVLVFPAGLLSDRFGRKRLNVFAGALAALGIFLLVLVRDISAVYVFGAIIGMATGIFVSVNWALATDLIPSEEAGKYLGLSNLATAGAGALSRLAGPLIDGVNALRPGAYWGYPTMFVFASASVLVGTLLLLLRVREKGSDF
jgi:Na+/melibiose symporter-like transporter